MMVMTSSLLYFLLGCMLGFVAGFIVGRLQKVEKKVEEVDAIVKNQETHKRYRDEFGFVRYPLVLDIALLLVICLTVWAAVSSQITNNKLEKAQDRIAYVTLCNQEYLKAQAEFLDVVLEDNPPATTEQEDEALRRYFELLTAYANADSVNLLGEDTASEALTKCLINPDKAD